ncbi:MAG TPA: hypothetical protein LFW21_00945 [Rickettsia endosymbiont of Pyrocoelia pectoralis]|nr:hypothetical protein [Rickettsia endosymbiont of Pyrocoelia pectoralis]
MVNFDQDRKKEVLKIQRSLNEDETKQLLDYLESNPEITTLDLASSGAKDSFIKKIFNSPSTKNITSLDLSWNYAVTNDIVGDLPRNLVDLKIVGCGIKDTKYKHLPPNLNSVSLFWPGAKEMESLNLPNLTNLNLYGCGSLRDVDLKNLSPNLTNLALREASSITDEGLKNLSPNLTNLTLDQSYFVTNEGLKNLPQNLTNLKLENMVRITGEAIKNLPQNLSSLSGCPNIQDADIINLSPNLKELDLSRCQNITDACIKDLSRNLSKLNLSNCRITDNGIKDLPPGLISLNLKDCRELTAKILKDLPPNLTDIEFTNAPFELLAELMENPNIRVTYSSNPLIQKLEEINNRRQDPTFNLEQEISNMVEDIARFDRKGERVKYLLDRQDKYPFLINSKNSEGHSIEYFYTHNPEMQKYCFKKGLVPIEKKDVVNVDEISSTGVHSSEATNRTNFLTEELMTEFGGNTTESFIAAENYKNNVLGLFNSNKDPKLNKLTVDLLELSDQEKKSVMEQTLQPSAPIPSDQTFKALGQQATGVQQILGAVGTYLGKDAEGKYNTYYSSTPLEYDSTKDAKKNTTLPECIGLISMLADKTKPNLAQMQELIVTLCNKHPELIRENMEAINALNLNMDVQQLQDRKEAYGQIKSLDEMQIKKLFEVTSGGLDIEEVFKEQQKFKLAKQLYVASTTYGENNSACLNGVWVQVMKTSQEIRDDLNNKWEAYKKNQMEQEAQKLNISRENIKPFLDEFAKDELGKKDSTITANESLKDRLQDAILGMQDLPVNIPEKLSKEEEKILSVINTYFSEHIKEYLPNYDNATLPSHEQYKTLINTLSHSEEMQKFALDPDKYALSKSSMNVNSPPKSKEASKPTHLERLQAQREQLKQPQGKGM